MLLYSIIIPHKNIPKLLQRCLDSIPMRDDLELIIVDDNSDPKIVDFENFPGKDRENTTIIFDKSEKRAGRARNIALEHAKGKKILFADADDFFNYCINDILDEYSNDDSDIVFFKANSLDSEDYSPSNRADDRLNHFIDHYKENEKKYGNMLRYKCGEPWAKIIKKSVVDTNNITFEESIIHNDHRFGYVLGYHAKKIKTDHRALYCITTRKNSVSKNISEEALLTRIRIFGEAENFFKAHDVPSYAFWDLHISQLAKLYIKKDTLFKEGYDILTSLGYKKEELNRRLYYSIQHIKIFRRKTDNILYLMISKVKNLAFNIISKFRNIFGIYPKYI